MLKFAALKSDVELPFYASLASHKINHDRLNDSARRLLGLYELRPGEAAGNSCRVQLHGNGFTSDDVPANFYRAEGMIRNMNTIEDYRALDMTAVLNQTGRTMWDAIKDGTIYSCPSLLASFVMLCFADLKKYKFTYVIGFPALHSDSAWELGSKSASAEDAASQSRYTLSSPESIALVDTVQTWRYSVDSRQYGFFLAKKIPQYPNKHRRSTEVQRPGSSDSSRDSLGFTWNIGSLADFEAGFFNGVSKENRYICFADPSTHEEYPAWMLRNLLVLVRQKWHLSEAQILCYRDTPPRRHEARSIVIKVKCGDTPTTAIAELPTPKVTGWEKNSNGKFTSRIVNLGDYLDPQRLADQAVDLNLKLIKWRIAPSLNLDIVKDTKCLLLGAGTLGSYVSRNLLGWGVKHVTFVDNGKVSFSNPVRQPLFNFQDCLEGGKPKATRASEALKEIYPGVTSAGHLLSVPMAGHPVTDEAKVQADFSALKSLVDEHDVIFLLMDTRESRWLPTVMGKAEGKLVMNAALGFDSFVAMRHGVKQADANVFELGCYFCNDVVAPADSVSDRTLDQQCTVTRPGCAAIASAILVEMMVSVLQDKKGAHADAPKPGSAGEQDPDHPLGIVPHQIRGSLSTFTNHVITGKSYDCCSACSEKIVDKYKAEGWEFVKRAMNEKGYVEELSGLAEVQRAAEEAAANVEWDDEDGEADNSEAELL